MLTSARPLAWILRSQSAPGPNPDITVASPLVESKRITSRTVVYVRPLRRPVCVSCKNRCPKTHPQPCRYRCLGSPNRTTSGRGRCLRLEAAISRTSAFVGLVGLGRVAGHASLQPSKRVYHSNVCMVAPASLYAAVVKQVKPARGPATARRLDLFHDRSIQRCRCYHANIAVVHAFRRLKAGMPRDPAKPNNSYNPYK